MCVCLLWEYVIIMQFKITSVHVWVNEYEVDRMNSFKKYIKGNLNLNVVLSNYTFIVHVCMIDSIVIIISSLIIIILNYH